MGRYANRDFGSGLDDLGGVINEAARARQAEIEEEQKRDVARLALRKKLAVLDAGGEEAPTEGDTNLATFGTTDERSIRELKASGGIYEDPKTLGLRMKTDQAGLRKELEAQTRPEGDAGMNALGEMFEGVGTGGERYFANTKANIHQGVREGNADPESFKRYEGGGGGGTFSVIGGGGSREQKNADKATAALRRLDATPAAPATPDDVMRDVLKHRDFYKGLGAESGAEDAEATLVADALAGKVPMHAVQGISKMLAAEVREFNAGYGGGIPPDRTSADLAREANAKLAEQAKVQKEANDLTQLKEIVDQSKGGTLKPAVDTAKALAKGGEEGEPGTAKLEADLLEARRSPVAYGGSGGTIDAANPVEYDAPFIPERMRKGDPIPDWMHDTFDAIGEFGEGVTKATGGKEHPRERERRLAREAKRRERRGR